MHSGLVGEMRCRDGLSCTREVFKRSISGGRTIDSIRAKFRIVGPVSAAGPHSLGPHLLQHYPHHADCPHSHVRHHARAFQGPFRYDHSDCHGGHDLYRGQLRADGGTYVGFEAATTLAEDVVNPKRNERMWPPSAFASSQELWVVWKCTSASESRRITRLFPTRRRPSWMWRGAWAGRCSFKPLGSF